MQSIEQKMDVSLTSEAITKIATRSYEISISSLWTIYLNLVRRFTQDLSNKGWAYGPMYVNIDLVISPHHILLSKVIEPYEIIWPTYSISKYWPITIIKWAVFYNYLSNLIKVIEPYEIIWPIVPLSIGRLQLSNGQCFTTISPIL